ncbi:MAG TPA: glycosyltransferase [Chitinophagaceae bacterium]|nr:glycosyltransferase [Chitinophagaceae bacterium]
MKFCFFGEISESLKGHTKGGGELQVALLAKALALKGHEVVIVDPCSSESFITDEGIKLINLPDWNKGIRGLRLFFNRIPALRKLLISQKADYYYVRMRSYLHLIPYRAARKNGSKFILGIACDLDVLSFRKKFNYEYKTNFNLFKFLTIHIPGDIAHSFLLRNSDYDILQHSGQSFGSSRLKSNQFVFPNIMEQSNVPWVSNPSGDYFLFAGTLTMLKGADNLLKLINIVNDSIPIMVVGLPWGEKPEKIYEELKKKKNVTLKGRKNHKETLELISNAKALINTSYYEGFSNVFLEAWATGVPVISLNVNPGDVLNKYNLGICCGGDLHRMKQCIESDETATLDKSKLISYVSEFHNFDTAADRFLNILNNSS